MMIAEPAEAAVPSVLHHISSNMVMLVANEMSFFGCLRPPMILFDVPILHVYWSSPLDTFYHQFCHLSLECIYFVYNVLTFASPICVCIFLNARTVIQMYTLPKHITNIVRHPLVN